MTKSITTAIPVAFAAIACEAVKTYTNEDYRPLISHHVVSWAGVDGSVRRILVSHEMWSASGWPYCIEGLPTDDVALLDAAGLAWESDNFGLFAGAVEYLIGLGGHGWLLALAEGTREWNAYVAKEGAEAIAALRAWDAASGDAPLGLSIDTGWRIGNLKTRLAKAVQQRVAQGVALPAGVREAAPALVSSLIDAAFAHITAEATKAAAQLASARAAYGA